MRCDLQSAPDHDQPYAHVTAAERDCCGTDYVEGVTCIVVLLLVQAWLGQRCELTTLPDSQLLRRAVLPLSTTSATSTSSATPAASVPAILLLAAACSDLGPGWQGLPSG